MQGPGWVQSLALRNNNKAKWPDMELKLIQGEMFVLQEVSLSENNICAQDLWLPLTLPLAIFLAPWLLEWVSYELPPIWQPAGIQEKSPWHPRVINSL